MSSLEQRDAASRESQTAPVSTPSATSSPRALLSRLLPGRVKKGLRDTLRNLKSLPCAGRLALVGLRNGTILEYFTYDILRYWRHAGRPGDDRTRMHLRSRIVMDYHRLEKGLSLSDTRQGFGVVAARELVGNLRKYVGSHGRDDATDVALAALVEYEDFNVRTDASNPLVCGVLSEFEYNGEARTKGRGGTVQLTREEVHANARMDLSRFFTSRHSVRHFSGEAVDVALLKQAVRMAQFTPSVCNRQSARVHIMSTPELKREALKWQNGNRGFSEQIDKVLIVTSDLECFVQPAERYQAWIDGGMFAMSLIYALHSLGLGTCCLNWDVAPAADRGLRKTARLPENESVIMMIAVGHLPDAFAVASSPRNDIDAVVTVH